MIPETAKEAVAALSISPEIRLDETGKYFQEARLRAEVERMVFDSLPIANSPEEYSAVRRVIDAANIPQMVERHNGNVSGVVAELVRQCQLATDRANMNASLYANHQTGNGRTGRVRYNIISQDGSLGLDDLSEGDHRNIQSAIHEIFSTEGLTDRATYDAVLGVWRIELSGARFVYLGADSIRILGGQGILPNFGAPVLVAPMIVDGEFIYTTEPPSASALVRDAMVGAAASVLLSALLDGAAEETAVEPVETATDLPPVSEVDEEEVEAVEATPAPLMPLMCEDVGEWPEAGFSPTMLDVPHASVISAMSPYPMHYSGR